jgi:hypothetical protein
MEPDMAASASFALDMFFKRWALTTGSTGVSIMQNHPRVRLFDQSNVLNMAQNPYSQGYVLSFEMPDGLRLIDVYEDTTTLKIILRIAVQGTTKVIEVTDDKEGFPSETLMTKLRIFAP